MSTGMLRLDIDARELERAPGVIARAWLRAGNRTVSKTSRWALTHALRGIARAEQIPVSRLRRRKRGAVKIRRVTGANHGIVWFGLRPIPASAVGKPRQLKRRAGVKVGQHFFSGAFIATMRSGHVGVWLRATRKRLPIVEQMVLLEKAPAAIAEVQRQVPARLREVMRQELNFEMHRRGGT